MNNDPDTSDEIPAALKLAYMAGTLSPSREAEIEVALAGSPQLLAKLQRSRARVEAMSSPDKTREVTERLKGELEEMGMKPESPSAASASQSLASAWQVLSTAVRELLDFSIPIPAFGAAPLSPGLCLTKGSGGAVEFSYGPDGSLKIMIVSPEAGDEGALLDVEIQSLPARRVQLVRRSAGSFEVEGNLVLTPEEQRQLPAAKEVILREVAPAK